jgi:hypothetical protein
MVIWLLRQIPYVQNLAEKQLEWVFIGIMFLLVLVIIKPLIKWSITIAAGAAIVAGVIAYFTSFSFWGLLPFTGLGVAIVLLSHKFQME